MVIVDTPFLHTCHRLFIRYTAITGYVNHHSDKHLTIINGYYSNNTSNIPTLHHTGDTRPSHH